MDKLIMQVDYMEMAMMGLHQFAKLKVEILLQEDILTHQHLVQQIVKLQKTGKRTKQKFCLTEWEIQKDL